MDFLAVLFFIIVGFYILGKVLKFALRFWLARKVSEFQQRGFGGFNSNSGGGAYSTYGGSGSSGTNQRQSNGRPEGQINVSGKAYERRIKDNVGEYVEFDEVK